MSITGFFSKPETTLRKHFNLHTTTKSYCVIICGYILIVEVGLLNCAIQEHQIADNFKLAKQKDRYPQLLCFIPCCQFGKRQRKSVKLQKREFVSMT